MLIHRSHVKIIKRKRCWKLATEEQTVNLRYKKHATLTKYTNHVTGEICWLFESEELTSNNIEMTIIEVLEDLSIEGWELVCPLIEGDGYILRSTEYHEETI